MEISAGLHYDPTNLQDKKNLEIRPFSTFNSSTERPREVTAIVAMNQDGVIGAGGGIPWHLPEDLAHFKRNTLGHPVIMGRKTWESLPFRPLPGRRNIVISRNPDFRAKGAEPALSPEAAIALCSPAEKPFIIGGGAIYREAFPFCTRLIVTMVETSCENPDTYFPEIDMKEWELSEESEMMTSRNGMAYHFLTYTRRAK